MASRQLAAGGVGGGVGGVGINVSISASRSPFSRPRRQQQQRLALASTHFRRRHPSPLCVAAAKGFGSTANKKKSTTEKGMTPTPPWLADASVCPCCSGRKFETCCSPFISGSASPQTAEQLMRSRFAAYVKKDAQYIIRTTHPLNRAAAGSKGPDGAVVSSLAQDVAATIKRVSWQRLKVEGTEGGGR